MPITREDQLVCRKLGGTWQNGVCVIQGKVSVKVFKGNPCQGRFITMAEKAGDPAELRTLAKVALKSLKTRK